MKRFIIAIALIFASTAVVSADERPIDVGQMPKAAINFLNENFAGIKVLYANVEREVLDTDYEVGLVDGTRIDFNGMGEWREVSNKRAGVPSKLLPAAIVRPDLTFTMLCLHAVQVRAETETTTSGLLILSLSATLLSAICMTRYTREHSSAETSQQLSKELEQLLCCHTQTTNCYV